MSQRRLETFLDLSRRLGTSRTSYKKSYAFVNKLKNQILNPYFGIFTKNKLKTVKKTDRIFIKNYIKDFYNI